MSEETIKGNLILKEDTTFNEDLKVEGDILGNFNLKVIGNIDCLNINCKDIDCWNINCGNINCWDIDCLNINCGNIDCLNINCGNIDCWDIDCRNINCGNIDCLNINCGNIDCWNIDCLNINCRNLYFYAIAIAYNSFKCKSWKAKRKSYIIKCLDKEIEIKDKKLKKEIKKE